MQQRVSRLPLASLARAQAPVILASVLAPSAVRSMSMIAHKERSFMQYSSMGMAFLLPAAMIEGSPLKVPADYFLAVGIPAHAYFGFRSILLDYVPSPSSQKVAVALLGAVCAISAAGLLRLNVQDVGVTGGIKLLWQKKKVEVVE